MSTAATEAASEKLHGANWIGASRHATPLRDEFKPSELNPAFNGNPNFDWESVFTNLDGADDESIRNAMGDVEVRQAASKMTARMFSLILDWLLQVNLQDHRAVKAIGIRAVAMAWVVDPGLFEGASLTTVAKSLGYSSGRAMNQETVDFSRRFGITNHFQNHCPDKEKSYATPAAQN
ncbi:MAG: hypothetical protein ACLP2Y_02740 [Limisphaerales bacterium]